MKVVVTGARGFLGSHVVGLLEARGHTVLSTHPRDLLSVMGPSFLTAMLVDVKPDAVVHLAYPSYGGGIGAMAAHPWDLLRDCVRIDTNVIEACVRAKVPKLVCMGSVCGYSEYHDSWVQTEADYVEGQLTGVNAPYGYAKRLQLMALQAARAQHGLKGVHLILDNLYGPGDRSGHVIPTILGRLLAAHATNAEEIAVWGSGQAQREFLYVEDAARGVVDALERYDAPDPVNLVTGTPVSLADLVVALAHEVGWYGKLRWDTSRPEGARTRRFSRHRAETALGWRPQVSLFTGLVHTVAWARAQTPAEVA